MKIVGGDTFYSYYTLYQYFKIKKKIKNTPSFKKKPQAVFLISYRRALYNFKTIEWIP